MQRFEVSNLTKGLAEPRGFSDKYWVHTKEMDLLIKYNGFACKGQDVMECISSDILKGLNIDTVDVRLGFNSNASDKFNGNCCIIGSFLNRDGDITINLLNNKWTMVKTDNIQKNISSCFLKMFTIFHRLMGINENDFNNMKRNYIRTVFGDCIIDNEDRSLKNIEAIYNEKDFSYRLAPSFDNGFAFNAFEVIEEKKYESECYIGEQRFSAYEIMRYIIEHYYEDVADICENLNYFTNNKLETIIEKYAGEIDSEKLVYIDNYINYVNSFINDMVIKKGYGR